MPRGKFILIALNVQNENGKKSQISNLNFHFKYPEKEEQNKPKGNRQKEISTRTKINEAENGKM